MSKIEAEVRVSIYHFGMLMGLPSTGPRTLLEVEKFRRHVEVALHVVIDEVDRAVRMLVV